MAASDGYQGGYQAVDFWRYGLAVAMLSGAGTVLETKNERWAWRYVQLLLVMLILWHAPGLLAFGQYVAHQVGGNADV